MTDYTLNIRGNYYRVTPAGYIDSGYGKVSKNWSVHGVSKHWASRSPDWNWKQIKAKCDAGKTVEGYLFDIDHGTYRKHGGAYGGKIPKARIWKR